MEMEDWLDELCTNNQDSIDDWDEPTRPDSGSNTPQGQGKKDAHGLEGQLQTRDRYKIRANSLQERPRVSKDFQGAEGAR